MNIIAVAAMAAIVYMGLVHGLYRSAQTLVICVLAGAIAFGLLGPASGLVGSSSSRDTWYYAADPFCLWAIFCAAFLLLQTLAAKLFPHEPGFPSLLNQLGGAIFGIGTGYLVAGLCVLLIQMLPTSPELLGYEAFKFKRGEDVQSDSTKPGDLLWLQWDRGAVAFFGYLTSGSLGSHETGFYRRYGDVYPPADRRGEDYEVALDGDDVLYFYWYRRWEFFGASPEGPIKEAPRATASREGPGLRIAQGHAETLADVSVRISLVERLPAIETFPQEKPPANHEFLLITIRFRPTGRPPRTIDSSRFVLLETSGGRFENPMVLGRAKAGQPQPGIVPEYAKPSVMTARSPRFNIPPGGTEGFYLASGASFTFTEAGQEEQRTFAFVVPKQRSTERFRLNVQPEAGAAPRPATPAAPKPATVAPTAPATKPPAS
jgi:hypothetical protein